MASITDNIIAYVENPKELIENLPELKSEFFKAARYTVNTQKSILFLYISNVQLEI